jgi:signal transduction histidine kinase
MQERAAELGGTFSIQPVTAGGTRIVVRLPLES